MGTIQRQLFDLITGQKELNERLEAIENRRYERLEEEISRTTEEKNEISKDLVKEELPSLEELRKISEDIKLVLESLQSLIATMNNFVTHSKEKDAIFGEESNFIISSLILTSSFSSKLSIFSIYIS